MGQKANPNSFNSKNKFIVPFGINNFSKDYGILFKEQKLILKNLTFLFEKYGKGFVKDCLIFHNNKSSNITIFISFLRLKFNKKKRNKNIKKNIKKNIPEKSNKNKKKFKKRKYLKSSPGLIKILNKYNRKKQIFSNFFAIFRKYGYSSNINLIYQNLNTLIGIKMNDKTKNGFYFGYNLVKRKLYKYSRETYFYPALWIFTLISVGNNNSILFAKFIAKYFKKFHRNKRKLNKFLAFLTDFIQVTRLSKWLKIKGLKILIKGRILKASRTKKFRIEQGIVPLQTFKCKISYSLEHIHTSHGVFGIKVWIVD